MGFWSYCFEWRKWGIQRGDLVVEVGSGNRPMIRSDILVDKYISDDSERGGALIIDRPIVVADVVALPFKTKSIDFIYTSHLLEHVEEIEAALSEISCVGCRGIVIVPNAVWEGAMQRGDHKWLIRSNNETLIFREKCVWMSRPENDLLETSREAFYQYYSLNNTLFEVRYIWEGKIKWRVEMSPHYRANKSLQAEEGRSFERQVPLKSILKIKAKIIVRKCLKAIGLL